ncbi:HalOD1 output domain-containing protein [Halorussus sp. AFM4]|uniref:HalOD1 output domain-containing protein n=1 Tax=Halorussus sp. AFM4 TaxID=3421651 RepID=UPI003EBFBE76
MSNVQTATAGDRSVCQSVVEAVAEAEGVEPEELDPLYEVIDPDALEELFAPTATTGRMEGRVVFTYAGHEVTVCGDGYVSVEARDE